jgi:hypothetical protein
MTPMDLKRREPKLGVALQRKYRRAGGFIPHISLGNRFFYRTSSVEKWLAEQETKTMAPGAQAPEPGGTTKALTLGDDTLAEIVAKIIKTAPSSEEVRIRVAELLGGAAADECAADDSRERLWNAGGADESRERLWNPGGANDVG